MNLHEALYDMAHQLGVGGQLLQDYAEADPIHEAYYPQGGESGSPFAIPYLADGKLLFGLVRALRPLRVLEIGTNHGGSANHILAALDENAWEDRTTPELVSLDINPEAGQHVRRYANVTFTFCQDDVTNYVMREDARHFQLIHEDGSHERQHVFAVYSRLHHLMDKGGLVLSHDTATGMRDYILSGIADAGFAPVLYEYEESPCGFSVMRYKEVSNEPV